MGSREEREEWNKGGGIFENRNRYDSDDSDKDMNGSPVKSTTTENKTKALTASSDPNYYLLAP